MRRLGREQLRLNALIEAQEREFQAALQQLREQGERRESELAEALARRPAERKEARLQVVQRLLPVLDGLDQALSSGERLLERGPAPARLDELSRQQAPPVLPWWVVAVSWPIVLFAFLFPGRARRGSPERACAELARDVAAWREAHVAWLRGLELVRERFLETLALEGVQPIAAAGQAFDPYRHVAVDTAPAGPGAPSGTVIAEARRGYVAGDRVLRYAEVVVARDDARSGEEG